MKEIFSKNIISIPYPKQDIWPVICDIDSYPKWWPSSIKIKIIITKDKLSGSEIELRPYGGIPFYCEFGEKVNEDKIHMNYRGTYSGCGEWRLTESNNKTIVIYEINLKINNKFIKALSVIFPIDKIHYNLMNKVLINLGKRVGEIKNHIS